MSRFPVLERRGGDSNPRWTETPIPVFETGAFNRSATSPGGSNTLVEWAAGLPEGRPAPERLQSLTRAVCWVGAHVPVPRRTPGTFAAPLPDVAGGLRRVRPRALGAPARPVSPERVGVGDVVGVPARTGRRGPHVTRSGRHDGSRCPWPARHAPGARVVRPFAPRYSAPPGLEPYIARGSGQRPAGAACAFPTGDIYALRLVHGDGVTVVDARGGVALLTRLPSRGLEDGIVSDTTGRFGHRLLVSRTAGRRTTVFAIDCRGRVQILTRMAPGSRAASSSHPPHSAPTAAI